MFVALLIASALAAGQSAAPPSNGVAPDSAALNGDGAAPTPEEIDALQQLYDSSCGSRGYGEYDDVCILITKQLNDAKTAAQRAKRNRAKAQPPPSPDQTPTGPKG